MAVLSPYALVCSVCKSECISKSDWLKHLTGEGHQILARQECLEKWEKRKIRKCCLVIFSSFSLAPTGDSNNGSEGGEEKVVQYFSSNFNTFVTDFVWWEERRRIGIVQFESKKKVKDIISSLGDTTEVFIDNQKILVERAVDLLQLEWNAILPDREEDSSNSNNARKDILTGTQTQKTEIDTSQISPSLRANKKRNVESANHETSPSKKRIKSENIKQEAEESEPEPLSESSTPASSNHCTDNVSSGVNTSNISSEALQRQYSNILQSVRIPDHEFDEILKMIDVLKRLFRYHDPSAEVVIFRNWYLKLRHPNPSKTRNDLFLFVYIARPPSMGNPFSYKIIAPSTAGQILHMSDGVTNFTILESGHQNQKIWKLNYKPSNINFYMVTYPPYLVEVQMCRLVEYLLTFDPRCRPLMNLVYCWSTVNSAQFGREINHQKNNYHMLPEPITLQWFVMFFLCHKGITPTAREIQSRPHTNLLEHFVKKDCGFSLDPKFAKEWISTKRLVDCNIPEDDEDESSEQFILKVLELFQEFMEFYGETVASGCWILNNRDGELINVKKFKAGPPNKGSIDSSSYWTTKMSNTEFLEHELLKKPTNSSSSTSNQAETGENTKIAWKPQISGRWNRPVYMLHPFFHHNRFSLSKDTVFVLKQMRTSAMKLKKFLEVIRKDGENAARIQFGTIENVLSVDKRELRTSLCD